VKSLFALPAAALLAAAPAQAQFLLCTDGTNDRVILLDANDGTVLNPAYITLAPASPGTPIEALVVNNEIWVTDQVGDKIMRFSLDGTTWLGNYGTGSLNNCRGAAFVNGVFYVSNNAAVGTTPAESIVMFDTAGTVLGTFFCDDPFDVLGFQGDLLAPGIDDLDIFRFDLAGAPLGIFHNSDGVSGIDFPEQISLNNAGNVIAAGFTTPNGIYEYDAATGTQLNYWSAPGSSRGVEQLGNGLYITSSSTLANGIRTFDPVSGALVSVIPSISAHFFSDFGGAGPPNPVAFCAGDGTQTDHTTTCPCGNDATTPGNGCGHSFDPGGANLSWTGIPANDDVVLGSSLTPVSSFTLFMQHDTPADAVFHDGVICAGGTLVRLRGRNAVAGAATFPNTNFPNDATLTLSQRGQVIVGSGAVRFYSAFYRNASTTFCPPATANVTNGVQITW